MVKVLSSLTITYASYILSFVILLSLFGSNWKIASSQWVSIMTKGCTPYFPLLVILRNLDLFGTHAKILSTQWGNNLPLSNISQGARWALCNTGIVLIFKLWLFSNSSNFFYKRPKILGVPWRKNSLLSGNFQTDEFVNPIPTPGYPLIFYLLVPDFFSYPFNFLFCPILFLELFIWSLLFRIQILLVSPSHSIFCLFPVHIIGHFLYFIHSEVFYILFCFFFLIFLFLIWFFLFPRFAFV